MRYVLSALAIFFVLAIPPATAQAVPGLATRMERAATFYQNRDGRGRSYLAPPAQHAGDDFRMCRVIPKAAWTSSRVKTDTNRPKISS